MKSGTKIYIDTRHEKYNKGGLKRITYLIKDIEKEQVKQKLFEAIGLIVQSIEVIPNSEKVFISYHENRISPTFIDYKLQLKGLDFKKVGT